MHQHAAKCTTQFVADLGAKLSSQKCESLGTTAGLRQHLRDQHHSTGGGCGGQRHAGFGEPLERCAAFCSAHPHFQTHQGCS
eukprot:1289060-Alexandrium_andersonii.AAC.1